MCKTTVWPPGRLSTSRPQVPSLPPTFGEGARGTVHSQGEASFCFFLALARPRNRRCCLEKIRSANDALASSSARQQLPEQTACTVKKTEALPVGPFLCRVPSGG